LLDWEFNELIKTNGWQALFVAFSIVIECTFSSTWYGHLIKVGNTSFVVRALHNKTSDLRNEHCISSSIMPTYAAPKSMALANRTRFVELQIHWFLP